MRFVFVAKVFERGQHGIGRVLPKPQSDPSDVLAQSVEQLEVLFFSFPFGDADECIQEMSRSYPQKVTSRRIPSE